MEIEKFLYGHNDAKYLVNVIGNPNDDFVECIYHYPDGSKKVIKEKYRPFIHIKDIRKLGIDLYPNKTENEKRELTQRSGIKFQKLKTYNNKRLINGYSYIVFGETINKIKDYFKRGGYEIGFNDKLKVAYILKPEEIFLIQTGKRLFKGIEKYDDLHKVTYDIETTGLEPETDRIFMIGAKDNRTESTLLGVNKVDDDEEERKIIKEFFNYYISLKPAIINHYNGEDFDWNFILKRCEILGIDLLARTFNKKNVSVLKNMTTLKNNTAIRRIDNSSLKVGNETLKYTKTSIWGINNIDIIHATKRTQAINSDIKATGLKYICQFEGVAKKNRTYVQGDKIYQIWNENKNYIINPLNNIYKVIPDKYQTKSNEYLKNLISSNKLDIVKNYFKIEKNENLENLKIINGSEIVKNYLIDDLIETNEVDKKYNESSFMLAQMIPTTFERICTMGNAAVWKLIMSAWSYENNLAIPIPDEKEKFSGGLARAYHIGFARKLGKVDFAGLYPTIELTYDAFPNADVTNILKKILLYLLINRNKYKELANDETLDANLRSFYKTKQLPLKILNNSLFGALGSGESFPWGESNIAARITCIGRLHLRKLIRHFIGYSYVPILAVTDGVNFEIPDFVNKDLNGKNLDQPIPINNLVYIHNGKEYFGHDAIVEKYNYEILNFNTDEGRFIKVDNDGLFKSSITISRINYALKLYDKLDENGNIIKKGKVKLTGNTIKSKGMPEYIEEFIDNGMELLLNDKAQEFVDYYYEYLEKIYYKQIPLKKIASRSKVKMSLDAYKNREKDKNGKDKARQAHMELCIRNNVEFKKGAVIYYVNIGTAKSHGDTKILINKKTGEEIFSSYMIDNNTLENNPEMLGEYNVKKYIDAFNKKVESILIGFNDKIMNNLLKENPDKREYFTKEEVVLIKKQNDSIKDSMYMETEEIKHWNNTGYDPNIIYNGFKIPEGENLNGVEEYKISLTKLNNKFPDFKIKAIYDKYNINDYVLKKNKEEYTIHRVNENEYLEDVTEEILTKFK
jgi:DNA polymerase elongation subunit (family B)